MRCNSTGLVVRKVLGLMHKSLVDKSELLPGVNVCECVCLVMDCPGCVVVLLCAKKVRLSESRSSVCFPSCFLSRPL